MKKILCRTAILFSLSFFVCSCADPETAAPTSDFPWDHPDEATVENLEVLARVWGFVKYHHPVFWDGEIDVDEELFRLLPEMAGKDAAARNAVLYDWVSGLGEFRSDEAIYAPLLDEPHVMTTEAEWITPELLGRDLSDLLGRMRYADRKRGNFYIKYTDLRPTMTNESQDGSLDDYRVRLLFLFRFWNAMEYFNPNRNLTDKPWDKVLGEYIPLFLRSDIKYSSIMRLYAELCDTHGAQFSWSLFGGQTVPASVTFAGDRVFVIRDGVLRKGDEILSVDGRQWSETYDMLKQYEPVSNDVMRGLQTARALLLTTKSTVRVEIIRDGRKQTLLIDTQLSSSWHRQGEEDMIEQCEVKVYDGAVGYMTGLHYTRAGAAELMERFRDTRALIVDMRCYPREFMVFDFIGQYFIRSRVNHVTWCVSETSLPGYFYLNPDKIPDPQNPEAYYPGKVIVLVDPETQSSAEYTTMAFQAAGRCTVVGRQTAGADGNVSPLLMPAGFGGWFSGLGVLYPDGVNSQRAGVRIDVPVEVTPEGLAAGRDEILERALEIARQ